MELEEKRRREEDVVDRWAPSIVRGSIAALGIAGLSMIARSMRLFTKFEHVREIPAEFVRKEMLLSGRLKAVEPSGALRIEHLPLVRPPFRLWPRRRLFDHDGLITVRLAGLDVTDKGRCFLRESTNLLDRPLTLALVKRTHNDPNSLDCNVFVKKGRFRTSSLNQELVRRGMARVPGVDNLPHLSALQMVPAYSRLVNQLIVSEKIADHRGVGMWERESWVERMQALPYQLGEICRTSSPFRFVLLVASGTRLAVERTVKTLKTCADKSIKGWRWAATRWKRIANWRQRSLSG